MITRLLFSVLILCSSAQIALSCSCVYIPTFCETLTFWDGVIDTNYLVVYARADKKLHDGLRITPIDVLFGSASETTIEVRRGNGADCLVNTDFFEEGKEYVFAFYGKFDGKYNLGSCGISWLEVRDGIATGAITEEISSIPVSRLYEVVECPGLRGGTGSVSVYPNPASEFISIAVDGGDDKRLDLQLYDTAGRLILRKNAQTLQSGIPYQINVRALAQGMYFLKYYIGGIGYCEKIIVAGPL